MHSRRASNADASRRSSVHVIPGDEKHAPIVFANDKPGVIHNELYLTETGTKLECEVVDYSGAHEKTDPAEIALVKKLDRWIMPTLWIMYWLNYL